MRTAKRSPASPAANTTARATPAEIREAERRGLTVFDATCPLVTKVHHEVKRMAAKGYDIIYVGHEGHDEAVGTIAEAPDAITLVEPETGLGEFSAADPDKVALVAQTTLGLHEWREVMEAASARFPELRTARKSDLCYATTNRQEAVKQLSDECDMILVVGSHNSSNTRALVRVSEENGVSAYRIDSAADIEEALKAAGREDPDLILVGEMRDSETMAAALTADVIGVIGAVIACTYFLGR